MSTLTLLIQLWIIHTVFGGTDHSELFGTSPRSKLNFIELANYDGYKAEHHYVTTSDGYILDIFRIPPYETCTTTKGVILFMHGLYFSSDDCLIPVPGVAHCYIYSDNCYDVWAPNSRGSFYSRNHTTYDPDTDPKFWNFTFDEIAVKDLPASIDYILKATNNTQLSYVGHAQGVTIVLLLCAKIPEYNDKIKVGIGMSVTAWLDHSKFIVVKLQGILEPLITAATTLGVDIEVLNRGGLVQTSGSLLCGLTELSYPFCSVFIFAILGYNQYQITDDVLPVVVGHTPSGTSLKNLNRWGQIRNNGFSEYDYGNFKNLLVYGHTKPPLYDLSKITMKWVFIGSMNDYVANVTDVRLLVSKLPNAAFCVLSEETFGHLDFIYGKDIPKYITPTVLSQIETDTYECALT